MPAVPGLTPHTHPSLSPTTGVPGPHVGGPAPAEARGDPAYEPSLPPVPAACAPGCPGERGRVSGESQGLCAGGWAVSQARQCQEGPRIYHLQGLPLG